MAQNCLYQVKYLPVVPLTDDSVHMLPHFLQPKRVDSPLEQILMYIYENVEPRAWFTGKTDGIDVCTNRHIPAEDVPYRSSRLLGDFL